MTDVRLDVIQPEELPEDERQRIIRELDELIEGEVRFGSHDRMLYATDASIYQVMPIGVVIPRHLDDVKKVVAFCTREGLPILPRGAGASLAGQTVNVAVVLDLSVNVREILEIDHQEKTARVEPGVVLDHLNSVLAGHGLTFGPDVATSTHANLGGMIGNNSAGIHSILYGRTVENILSLDCLLADGRQLCFEEGSSESDEAVRELTRQVAEVINPLADLIDERFPRTLRRVDGYNLDLILAQLRTSTPGTFDRVNLAHLLCGSEGTLAVTTAAKLKLVELPKRKGLAIIGFPDLESSLDALNTILQTHPAAVELIDDMVLQLAGENAEYRRYVRLLPNVHGARPGAVLYVEYFGKDDEEIAGKFQEFRKLFNEQSMVLHTDPNSMLLAWKLRKAGEALLYGLPGLRKPLTFIEDTTVDPSRLPAFVRAFQEIVARHDTTAAYYAHASVGCLHIRPLINLRDPDDIAKMLSITHDATDLVKEYGGALSGEHGDGRLRSHLLKQFYGSELCAAFAKIKKIFDPMNLMNPGNIIAPEPMDVHLRIKPRNELVEIPPVKTYFRYEREKGFASAVEMCNGAGICRKTTGGTMCPSYRALRDERHAPRGRGNALRLAISGQFSGGDQEPAWNDSETLATLDLCLSCKACKVECPSNVDIARLKAEFLAQGYDASGGPPLAVKIFGHVRMINRVGSLMPGLTNALTHFGPLRSIINKATGIDPRRSLPRFARPPSVARPSRSDARPSVLLFPDCFTTCHEPGIAGAALDCLDKLGYRVVMPKLGCCGRSLISTGQLREAIFTCEKTARALLVEISIHDPVAILGCEPSCISAIRDDWLDLKMNIDVADLQRLADQSMLIEEFILERWSDHPKPPTLKQIDLDVPVLLHGHCHQKALWGVEQVAQGLKRFAGSRLNVLDSGCCGMAGAFGMTADHYDLSMKIAEQSLFGLLRDQPDAIVLASGTSCRHQIRDGLDRKAIHPIEFIERGLDASL